MISIRQKYRRQFVETDHAIRLRILNARALSGRFQLAMVLGFVPKCQRELAEEDILLNKGKSATNPKTEFMESRTEVTGLV